MCLHVYPRRQRRKRSPDRQFKLFGSSDRLQVSIWRWNLLVHVYPSRRSSLVKLQESHTAESTFSRNKIMWTRSEFPILKLQKSFVKEMSAYCSQSSPCSVPLVVRCCCSLINKTSLSEFVFYNENQSKMFISEKIQIHLLWTVISISNFSCKSDLELQLMMSPRWYLKLSVQQNKSWVIY